MGSDIFLEQQLGFISAACNGSGVSLPHGKCLGFKQEATGEEMAQLAFTQCREET